MIRSVTDLARLSLDKPVYVSVHENSSHATPENLVQSYIVTDIENKVYNGHKVFSVFLQWEYYENLTDFFDIRM